jgi:hypothetical protein
MTHKIIKVDNYLLVVDDSDMVGNGYRLDIERMSIGIIDDDYFYNTRKHIFKKVIAHLPINDSRTLEGVDLLPPYSRLQEDGLDKKSVDFIREIGGTEQQRLAFKDGYLEAKEKYKYTEKDVRKAITMARELENWRDLVWEHGYDDILQFILQDPTEFECEMETIWVRNIDRNVPTKDDFDSRPKTITTAQGIQWVGKYK